MISDTPSLPPGTYRIGVIKEYYSLTLTQPVTLEEVLIQLGSNGKYLMQKSLLLLTPEGTLYSLSLEAKHTASLNTSTKSEETS